MNNDIKEKLDNLRIYAGREKNGFICDIEDYITDLQEELEDKAYEQLKTQCFVFKKRIDKAIEYITSYESIETIQQCEHSENNKSLDEKTIIEMTRRHLIVHDKLLNILKGNKGE